LTFSSASTRQVAKIFYVNWFRKGATDVGSGRLARTAACSSGLRASAGEADAVRRDRFRTVDTALNIEDSTSRWRT